MKSIICWMYILDVRGTIMEGHISSSETCNKNNGNEMMDPELMSPSAASHSTIVTNGQENKSQLDDLKKENDFLRDYVMRLTKEMLHLQEHDCRFESDENHHSKAMLDGRNGGKQAQGHAEIAVDLPLWMLDSNVIPPIFVAYDMRIAELSTYIEQQGSFLDRMTGSVHTLTAENKELRKRCSTESHYTTITNKKKNEDITEGEMNSISSTDAFLQQKDQDLQLLEQQADLLSQELDVANRSIQSRDESLKELTDELREKLDIVASLTKMNRRLEREKKISEQKCTEYVEKLSHYRNMTDELRAKVETLKENEALMASKTEAISADKIVMEKGNEQLHDELIQLSHSIQEIQEQLATSTREYDRLNTEYLNKSKELADARRELERSQKQLARMNLKFHKEYGCCDVDWREKIRELELLKNQAEAKVEALEELTNKMRDRESRLSELVGFGDSFQKICNQHAEEMEMKDSELREFKLKLTEIMISLESREQSLKKALSDNGQLEKALKLERESNKMNELESSLRLTNDSLHRERQSLQSALNEITKLTSDRSQLESSIECLRNEKNELKIAVDAKAQELKVMMSKHQTTVNELNVKWQSEVSAKEEDVRKIKESRRRLETENKALISILERKVSEKEHSNQETLKSTTEMREEMEKIATEYNKEVTKMNKTLQSITLGVKESHGQHLERIQTLTSQHTSLVEENTKLACYLTEQEKKLESSNLALARAENHLSNLGKQLGLSLRDQQLRIQRERELKLQNHALKLEVSECRTKVEELERHKTMPVVRG